MSSNDNIVKTYKKKDYEQIAATIEEYNNNGKKTIAIFTDAYYPAVDGVIKVLENQAALLAQNNNVILCVPKHKNKLHTKHCNYLVIGVASISASTVGYDLAVPAADAIFNKLIKKARIDIVHYHSPFTMGAFATTLAKKRKVPVIGTFHSLYKQDFYKAVKNTAISQILTSIIINPFNKSTFVTTMNSYAATQLREYGYKGQIKILPNSIGFKLSQPTEDEITKVKKELNITDDEIVFSFLGRFIIQKQILFIVDVLKILKTKGLKFKMLFIGNGPDAKKLKTAVAKNNLENEVIFTGLVKDDKRKTLLLAASDLFVFPSTYDTDGIVKIEAACLNVPSICVENTGSAATINDGVNGFISQLDTNIFASKILSIIKNRKALKSIGQQAFKDLYYSWEDIVSQLEEFYNEAIELNNIKLMNKAKKIKSKQEKKKTPKKNKKTTK